MPAVRIEFHPGAVADATGAQGWYAERSTIAARAFAAELIDAIESLRDFPERSPRYLAETRRLVLPRFPFSLIYRYRDGTITVVAVAHYRRKPGYWRSRH